MEPVVALLRGDSCSLVIVLQSGINVLMLLDVCASETTYVRLPSSLGRGHFLVWVTPKKKSRNYHAFRNLLQRVSDNLKKSQRIHTSEMVLDSKHFEVYKP